MNRITLGGTIIGLIIISIIVAIIVGLIHLKSAINEEAKTPKITKLNSGQNTAFVYMYYVDEFLKNNKNIRIISTTASDSHILILYEDLE